LLKKRRYSQLPIHSVKKIFAVVVVLKIVVVFLSFLTIIVLQAGEVVSG